MQDKSLITKRFSHSLGSYNRLATVQQRIAAELCSTLTSYCKAPTMGLEIGCGTGFLTSKLVEQFPETNWATVDLVEKCNSYLPKTVKFTCCDGEYFITDTPLDVITSASTVQWFDNLPEFINRAFKATNTNGLLALSTFGPENFKEITATTAKTLIYYTLDELEKICITAGYTLLYSKEWSEVLKFSTPIEVLHHIRATGVNAMEPTRWTKTRLQKFSDDYISKFGDATLTFNPQIIICRKNE